jgi:hypothetical protein
MSRLYWGLFIVIIPKFPVDRTTCPGHYHVLIGDQSHKPTLGGELVRRPHYMPRGQSFLGLLSGDTKGSNYRPQIMPLFHGDATRMRGNWWRHVE